MKRLRNLALALASGGVLTLAFPTVGWWWAAPVSIALLWRTLERATVRSGFGLGFVAGLAFFLPHIWWVFTSTGPVPWIALAALESLAMGLVGAAWALVTRRNWLAKRLWTEPLVFAALWVSGEQLRSIVPYGGFPWGRVAFSQLDAPDARLAWLGGAPLVSFVTVAAGACLGLAFEAVRARRAWIPIAAGGAGVAALALGLVVPFDAGATTGSLRVGVVQGNVPNAGLDAFRQARLVTENHRDETLRLAEDLPWEPDLLVWAENSSDFDPRRDSQSRALVTESAVAVGAPVLFGTQDYTPADGRYNTSLLWSEDGEQLDIYIKQHPAPFAEYLPLRSIAEALTDAADRLTVDMLPGTEPGVVTLPSERLGRDVVVGDVICFEVAYDPLIRSSIDAGAEILIVQTNNASFGLTAESEQQFAMARLRAIETGRSTVEVSTVGVSGAVLPDGTVVALTGLFTADHFAVELPLRTGRTPAVALGWWIEWGFLLLPGLMFAVGWLASLRGRWEWE